jgi:adenine phosphoribosyltransferase
MANKRQDTVMQELHNSGTWVNFYLLVVIENYMDYKHLSWEDIALIRIYDLNNDLFYTHLELCGTVPNGLPEGSGENEIELMGEVLAKKNLIKKGNTVIGSKITFGQLYHQKYPKVPPDDWTGDVECRSRQEALQDGLFNCLVDIFENWKLLERVSTKFRYFPNFPEPGVNFLSWDNLFLKPRLVSDFYQYLAQKYVNSEEAHMPINQDKLEVDLVIGLESRGFILSGPVALCLGVGQIFLRKEGKIAGPKVTQKYTKEYGSDIFELRADLPPKRVILVDDVLATGGSLRAAAELARQAGHTVVDCIVVKDVPELRQKAQEQLEGVPYRVILS